ncbi:MAG: hypothetical protein KUG72_08675 [Pseudomonadales bacterium]|nr:hypothetical protein [Pseudomonadales bacterium]
MKTIHQATLAIFLISFCSISHAYIGPGAGLTAIGSVLAFIGTIFLLIVGFAWYPVKRLLKGRKKDTIEDDALPEVNADEPE